MHQRSNLAFLPAHGQHKSAQPLLVQAGHGDDALYYYAPAISISASELLLYVAESSLLLDRLRLKRKMMVQVIGDAYGVCSAELSLASMPALAHSCALSLTLLQPCTPSVVDEALCCPIT